MGNREGQLFTDFTILCLDHMEEDVDRLAGYFFTTLTEKEQDFFLEHYQLCVGAAESTREAPKDVQEYIRKEAGRQPGNR